MRNFSKPLPLGLLAFFGIGVGLYPILYLLVDMTQQGLLASKPDSLLGSTLYITGFYTHILVGGLALSVGWIQFFPGFRRKRIQAHRTIGKVYIISVLLSGLAGFSLSFFATGGFIAALGFACLAIGWLFTTARAYQTIKRKEVEAHRRWMIRSYAFCFAAVTLRLWLPIFTGLIGWSFVSSYLVIAWLCWVPNIIFAEWMIRT